MWGTYPWFIEDGVDLIHPDDIDAFKKEVSTCKVFECIEEKGCITLRYNDKQYRVASKLFNPVPTPKYNFGEIVKLKKNGEEATITDIMWHYDKREHYYVIAIKNKRKSKRYVESEFL